MDSLKKRVSFILGILFVSFSVLQAQDKIQFQYDAAGNQTSRTIVMSNTRSAQSAKAKQEFFQEELGKTLIRLFPNPVKTDLTIEVIGFESKTQGELILYDMNGKVLKREKIDSSRTILDMQSLLTGNYVMHILLNGEQSVWKIIKE